MFNLSKKGIVSLVSLIAIASSTQLFSHNKVVVIPMEGDPAPTSKIIFYTENPIANGGFGGLDEGDSFCQVSADTAGVKGRFKAWLGISGSTLMPPRTGFKTFDLPYRNVDGSLVATGFNDFTNGLNVNTVIKSETGSVTQRNYWTGISSSITPFTSSVCNNWTATTSDVTGLVGRSSGNSSGQQWTAFTTLGCHVSSIRLLCFEQ